MKFGAHSQNSCHTGHIPPPTLPPFICFDVASDNTQGSETEILSFGGDTVVFAGEDWYQIAQDDELWKRNGFIAFLQTSQPTIVCPKSKETMKAIKTSCSVAHVPAVRPFIAYRATNTRLRPKLRHFGSQKNDVESRGECRYEPEQD